MSTLSEYVQAWRIREILAGRSGQAEPPALVCGNGTRFIVDAGSLVPLSWPATDDGPWTQFAVTWVGGPKPPTRAFVVEGVAEAVHAGTLVRFLEALGWPEEQLGKRWNKSRGNVPAGR